LDRVSLFESQFRGTFNYLNSNTTTSLARRFSLPGITHLTIADNEYICGLELAHILADVVKKKAMNKLSDEYAKLVWFMRIQEFIGILKKNLGYKTG
jgi:hypothetical protein